MIPVQGWLLLICVACGMAAESPPVGEAGLASLAAARGQVKAVAGTGVRTVQRADAEDLPGDPKAVSFAVTAEGRYDIVLTDPSDPDGERSRFVCDGTEVCEISVASADDAKPVRKWRKAAGDLLQRMLACLRLDLAALKAEYAVELKPAVDGLRELSLVPSDPAVLKEIALVSVIIDPAGRPVRVVLKEASGNLQRLEVKTFADDPTIDPARFEVPRPEAGR